MQGHKFKMACDQDCRAIYENCVWIPENKTKEGGKKNKQVFWSLVAVVSGVVL